MISVSSAPIAGLANKSYYDLVGTLDVLRNVYETSAVDGFELQVEPEWDNENPPLTDSEAGDWTKTPKYTLREVSNLVRKEGLPILSVHASRDIGNYLCSGWKSDMEKGERLIHDSLSLSSDLHAEVCVFHLWDTWSTHFDVNNIKKRFVDIAAEFDTLRASVENVPTHLNRHTPFSLVRQFHYVTLDLRWAALYDELSSFASVIDNVVNVHLRGRLQGDKWILDRSSFSFQDALDTIKNKWKYSGLFTVEPEGGIDSSSFSNFVKAMKSLKE